MLDKDLHQKTLVATSSCEKWQKRDLETNTGEIYIRQAKPGLRSALVRLCLGSALVVLVYEGLEFQIGAWNYVDLPNVLEINLKYLNQFNSYLNIQALRANMASVKW